MNARCMLLPMALLVIPGVSLLAGLATGQEQGKASSDPAPAAKAIQQKDASARIEGEKRFHANCGRCHQSPHKFPPRMMATIIRHMRVRATITDEDMRYILQYMTQ
jgi:mono/diheme cytochrome c family protein